MYILGTGLRLPRLVHRLRDSSSFAPTSSPPKRSSRVSARRSPSGNFQEAWNICQANRCFLSNVLGNGLERIGRNKDAVEFVVEETALRESNELKTNTTYLSVIGVVSPDDRADRHGLGHDRGI